MPAADNDGSPADFLESFYGKPLAAYYHAVHGAQSLLAGFTRYANDFMIPYMNSVDYFSRAEAGKSFDSSQLETFQAYVDLLRFNLDVFSRGFYAALDAAGNHAGQEAPRAFSALLTTLSGRSGEGMTAFMARQAALMEMLAQHYPAAIRNIEPEYGFHFERHPELRADETERFVLYRVPPSDAGVETDPGAKPVIILPPYVLGSNILSFLPGEGQSYAHSFANRAIPTYIRIMKPISECEAVQTMTGEDDALDTRQFCRKVMKTHGRPVTLNGYCQGGFSAVCNLASGELDGLVDALITCVSPMDGTRSTGLKHFLNDLPARFNDLVYGTKVLASGNRVADGTLMGWVYKLKSIEAETPAALFLRDLAMFARQRPAAAAPGAFTVSKTAAALNYWLINERTDLPLAITRMSHDSYTIPVADDGTLPVRLFNRKLNFKRLPARNIQWLICYGEADDLVEKETALAPLDYVNAEVTAFPKGHVAIATSWSRPNSDCALHTRFGECRHRGPVKFQLDLN